MAEDETSRRILEFTPPLDTAQLSRFVGHHALIAFAQMAEETRILGVITGLLTYVDVGRLRLDWGTEVNVADVTFVAIALLFDESK